MKVNVEKQDKNVIQLDIEIEAEIVVQEYNKACRKISENVIIPGFRKGKAPRAMVEKYVGADKIQKEALDRLLPNVFADTISEHQFDLAAEPYIESYKFELGSPLSVVAKLEIKPDVILNEYKGNTITVPKFKQPEDAIDREIRFLSEKFATLQTVINRPTTGNDIVVIDYNGTINGDPIKGGSAKNHQLDLANSNFIKGFAEQLVGKNLGEEFTIHVTFPEDYHDANLSGKNADFLIKINEIKEKIVPEVNDELAQRIGPMQTLEELKADLALYLEKTENTENKTRAEKAVIDKVVNNAQIEIPDSMINKEAKILLEEVQAKLKSQGISWEQVLDTQGHETIWKNLREEAAKRVKSSLVLGAIAKTENIQLEEGDFLEKVRELATLYNTDEKTVFKHISQNPGLAQTLTQQIMGQKVVEFIFNNNNINYVEDKLEYAEENFESD